MVHIKTLTTLFTPYLQQGNQSTTINRKKKDKLKVIEIFAVFCHFKESDRLPILHILTKFYEIQLGSVYIILLTDCGLSWADFFFRFGKILLHSNQTAIYMLIFALQRQSKCHISAVVMLCSSRRLRNSSWRLTNWEGEMLLVFTRTNTAAADPQSMKPYSCVCLRVCGGSLFVRHVAQCSEGPWPFLRELLWQPASEGLEGEKDRNTDRADRECFQLQQTLILFFLSLIDEG